MSMARQMLITLMKSLLTMPESLGETLPNSTSDNFRSLIENRDRDHSTNSSDYFEGLSGRCRID